MARSHAGRQQSGSRKLSLELSLDAGAPRAARGLLDGFRQELDDELTGRLELLVSELVTNSVVHGSADEKQSVKLELVLTREVVRASLTESHLGSVPVEQDQDAAAAFGLFLIEDQSDRWGVETSPDFRVWLELNRQARPGDCGEPLPG